MFFKKPAVEWLIVGLGNPGANYERTRHNAGFRVLALLADRLHVKIDRVRFRAKTARAEIEGHPVLLMMPQTYMNASGLSVSEAASFYKIPRERVLVISDDIDLPVGKLRVRREGSAGGHNGLKSITSSLGGQNYPRVKLGVGAKPHPDYELADWVLGRLSAQEEKVFADVLGHAADAVCAIVRDGTDKAMAKFNGM
ncbi:MAG: aminoacyl-tRNA hydrolase [Oscillospiraceae bacterium]|nr:aminoacyl-tRNA hydrolase [Oscillospiraceae bacterium]MBR2978281.1 aminoacyl-tRNA hydrolase [Oscillospiraceae bacterium]